MADVERPLQTWREPVSKVAAVFLGAILVVATIGKIGDPILFVEQIRKEGLDFLLPAYLVAVIGLAVEMALGMLLVLGVRHRLVLWASGLLVAFFAFLTGRNYYLVLTGQRDPAYDCGCFGVFLQRTATEAFWQDLFLLVPPLVLACLSPSALRAAVPAWKSAVTGLATLGLPSCPGVPASLAQLSVSLPYNDLAAVERLFHEKGGQVACVIIEPIAGNMGVVPPGPGFLQGLKDICHEHGALLIFDEVITGFRVALGGAQELYGVTPDLTTLGKIIGGGLPLGAYGGRAEIMALVAPEGPVYQAGTLSGNPLATAAGLRALDLLDTNGVYERLEESAARLYEGLGRILEAKGLPHFGNRVGSMFSYFFQQGPVTDWTSAARSDTELFGRWYRAMIKRGVYLAPSQYECTFVSLAHEADTIDQTLTVAEDAMKEL
jgi:uncharacterized membrane protein YphA (DoxX/SURF4 family)